MPNGADVPSRAYWDAPLSSMIESDPEPCLECGETGRWHQVQTWPARDVGRICGVCERVEVRCQACAGWIGIGIYCADCAARQDGSDG